MLQILYKPSDFPDFRDLFVLIILVHDSLLVFMFLPRRQKGRYFFGGISRRNWENDAGKRKNIPYVNG
jgi:hypothetical protein